MKCSPQAIAAEGIKERDLPHCIKSRVILTELVNPVAIGKHALYNVRAVWIEVMLLFDWIHAMAFLLPK